jgi:PAS domain S-box-containing protein
VAIVVSFLVRSALEQYLGANLPAFLLFYPTVMAAAMLAGLWPGLLATALASLLADYWIFKPVGHFAIANTSDAFALALFFAMGVSISIVAERLRRYQRRIAVIQRQLALRETEAKLKESEAQFETLANAIPQLCWMANADGWIFWYNQRWYSYTGTTPKQMEGWGWQSVHDPDSLPHVLEQWKASIATGEPFDMVLPLLGSDERFRPFLTRVMPMKDAEGKLVGWFGTNTDISEQKEIETDLRESKAKLDLALEVASLGEWEVDLKRNTGFRSPRHAQIYGYSSYQPEWSYQQFREHVLPDLRVGVDERFKAARTGGVWDFETQIRRADGEFRWIWVRGRGWRDESGEPARAFGIVMDITERKRAEENIREREALLQEVGHMAKVGGWEFDTATGEGSWTEQVARIHDLEPDVRISAERNLDFYVGTSRTLLENALREAVEQAKPYDLELEFISAKGIHKWVRTIGNPVAENGKVLKMRGSFQDITDRKEADNVLRTTMERFYAILSNMYSGILLVTNEGRIEFANRAFCDRFGLSVAPADLVGIGQGDMMEKIRHAYRRPDEDVARIVEIVRRGDPVAGEELAMQDGRTFLRDFIPIKIGAQLYGRLWLHTDITGRKRAEEALRASEERWATTLRSIGDAVISTDATGKVIFMNDVAQTLTGWPLAEAVGNDLETVFDIVQKRHESSRRVRSRRCFVWARSSAWLITPH